MPAGDRTGPNGSGPMTGRGMGFCSGYSEPGYTSSARGYFGRGRGGGFGGGGRGRRNRFYATGVPFRRIVPEDTFSYRQEYSPDTEIRMLKEEADMVQNELKAINDRINELQSIQSADKKKKSKE